MISCVAYAVEESASEANTARPMALPMVWWGASAVDKGRPMSQLRKSLRGVAVTVGRKTVVPATFSVLINPQNFFRICSECG